MRKIDVNLINHIKLLLPFPLPPHTHKNKHIHTYIYAVTERVIKRLYQPYGTKGTIYIFRIVSTMDTSHTGYR